MKSSRKPSQELSANTALQVDPRVSAASSASVAPETLIVVQVPIAHLPRAPELGRWAVKCGECNNLVPASRYRERS